MVRAAGHTPPHPRPGPSLLLFPPFCNAQTQWGPEEGATYMALAVTRRSALSKSVTPGTSTTSTYMSSMASISTSFPMQLICRNTEQASRLSSTL